MSNQAIYRHCCCVCKEATNCDEIQSNCILWPEELTLNVYCDIVYYTRVYNSNNSLKQCDGSDKTKNLIWGMAQEVTWNLTCKIFRIQEEFSVFDFYPGNISLGCSDISEGNYDQCSNPDLTENFRTGCGGGKVSYSSACCEEFAPVITGSALRTFYVPESTGLGDPLTCFFKEGKTTDLIDFEIPCRVIGGCDRGALCEFGFPNFLKNRTTFRLLIRPVDDPNFSDDEGRIVWPQKSNLILHNCWKDISISEYPKCCFSTGNLNGFNAIDTMPRLMPGPGYPPVFAGYIYDLAYPSIETAGKICTNTSTIIPKEFGLGNNFYSPRPYIPGNCICKDADVINCLLDTEYPMPEVEFEDLCDNAEWAGFIIPQVNTSANDGCTVSPSSGDINTFYCIRELTFNIQ